MQQADISKVRASVHQQCGSKVMIQLDRGRNKVDIQQGVIQHAYPSVFTILVNDERDDNQPQLLSFSYKLFEGDCLEYMKKIPDGYFVSK